MPKIVKLTGVYLLVSGIAMPVVWGILWQSGIFQHEYAVLAPEVMTIVLLITAGVSLLRSAERAGRLAFTALGALLYAVLFGCGKFTLAGQIGWAVFFAVIFCASATIGGMYFFSRNKE